MSKFQRFCVNCVSCGEATSKAFARTHDGQCKACVTDVARHACPNCGAPISAYKAQHHYVCESCYKQADPVGYANEVRFGDSWD